MQLVHLCGDRFAQITVARCVRVEGMPCQCRLMGGLGDEIRRRQVGLAVTQLERARHALGYGRDLDEWRFYDVQHFRSQLHRSSTWAFRRRAASWYNAASGL